MQNAKRINIKSNIRCNATCCLLIRRSPLKETKSNLVLGRRSAGNTYLIVRVPNNEYLSNLKTRSNCLIEEWCILWRESVRQHDRAGVHIENPSHRVRFNEGGNFLEHQTPLHVVTWLVNRCVLLNLLGQLLGKI